MVQTYFSRIASGLAWGLLWSAIALLGILLIFPVFSLPLFGGIAFVCITTGIVLNFRVVERSCPKCHTVSKVLPTGGKCPSCGQALERD